MNQIAPIPAALEAMCKEAIAVGATSDASSLMLLEHYFVPGAYARSLWRPKGTLIVGKTHKFACFTFLMSGRLAVWENGSSREIIAPAFFVSPAGSKKVTFAQEDSLLITVHPTVETDLDKIESELIVPEIDVVLSESVQLAIQQLTRNVS